MRVAPVTERLRVGRVLGILYADTDRRSRAGEAAADESMGRIVVRHRPVVGAPLVPDREVVSPPFPPNLDVRVVEPRLQHAEHQRALVSVQPDKTVHERAAQVHGPTAGLGVYAHEWMVHARERHDHLVVVLLAEDLLDGLGRCA